jgi:proteic killer suppression protein
MIVSVAHKGLRLFIENDDPSKLPAHLIEKIREILSLLDSAATPEQMNIPGYRLHKLSGDLKAYW